MEDYQIERRAQSLERYIEDLLRAWSDAQDMQRQLDKFNEEYEAPEPPTKFNSVLALLEYDEQRRRYEERMQRYSRRALEHQQTFEQKSLHLLDLFPKEVPLVYTYQTYGGSQQGKAYEIRKVGEDERASIQIRELES